MASVINTNSLSLLTQNNLTKSQGTLGTAIERLSSGLRINSAKDDAAGQAIANRFTANIRGLTQASRNANDGISLSQTTEGALNEVNNNLQRVRELAVQAANGSNSRSDLKSIQDEITQRLAEIDRTSAQTDFNGVKVLSASAKSLSVQVGANDGETISIGLKEISSKSLGLQGFNVIGPQGSPTAVSAADLKATYGASVTTSEVKETTANALSTRLGIASANVVVGKTAMVDKSGNWYAEVELKPKDQVESDALKAKGFDVAGGASAKFYIALDPKKATITGTGTAQKAEFSMDTANLGLSEFSAVATGSAMGTVDLALKQVDDLRSALGAVQNRFNSIIANLGTTTVNLSSSRSRIEDADYAVEVSNMTRSQILQQAGTSVLAQANKTTQSALTLLQ